MLVCNSFNYLHRTSKGNYSELLPTPTRSKRIVFK